MRKPASFSRGGPAAIAALVGFLLVSVMTSTPTASAEVHVDPTPIRAWGVDGRVYATAVVGDTVIVGGDFDHAVSPSGQQVARANLAAFDHTTGALRTGWRADTNRTVRALRVDGDQVYVGGGFTQIAGQTRRRIARLDALSGALDPAIRTNLNATVREIAVDADGFYVGGQFTKVNGAMRGYVARLHEVDGSLDTRFVAHANDVVFGLVRHPTAPTLYVAGRFGMISGAGRNGVAAVDSGTGAIRGVSFANSARPTLGLDINPDGTRLYGAGGSGTNTMAAWNTATGTRVWRHVAMGDIQAVDYFRGTVYFAFHEGFQGDTTVRTLAADATTGALDPAFRPNVNSFMGVFAIAASDDGISIGGAFTRVSGVTALRWAWFPASSGAPTPTEEEVAIAAGSTWRYYYLPPAPPAQWRQPGFDASGWATGRAVLGWGTPNVVTDLDLYPDTRDRPRAAYFRHELTIADLSAVTRLRLTSRADDGAVFYVNGVEVARPNMPAPRWGEITHFTYAVRAPSEAEAVADPVVIDVPLSLLVDGSNTIAVETHVNYRATPDLTFDLMAEITSSGG